MVLDLVPSRPALPIAVRNQLRRWIDDGVFPTGTQLPTEPDLARRLGVSRVTLRQALQMLAEDGVLVRRNGRGTFVTERPWLRASLDVNYSVTSLIEASGRVAGTIGAQAAERPADGASAELLGIAEGTPVVDVERVRTADGRPVTYSIDTLPRSILVGDPLALLAAHGGSMHRLLQERLGQVIHHGRAKLRAVSADAHLAATLSVARGAPLVVLETLEYNDRQEPLCIGREHVATDVFELWIYRRGPGRGEE